MRISVNPQGFIQLRKAIEDIGKSGARAAAAKSLRRAQTSMAKAASMRIRSSRFIKIKSGDAKKRIRAAGNFKGHISGLRAELIMSNKPESLGRFWAKRAAPPKGMKRTVLLGKSASKIRLKAVKVTVWGKTQYAGKGKAFMPRREGSSPNIFMRTSKQRLPIRRLAGPSFADFFLRNQEGEKIAQLGAERFLATFAQELSYRMSRPRRGR